MFETVDRALWEEHIVRVEQRIAESEGIIARQRAIIEGMERANLDDSIGQSRRRRPVPILGRCPQCLR